MADNNDELEYLYQKISAVQLLKTAENAGLIWMQRDSVSYTCSFQTTLSDRWTLVLSYFLGKIVLDVKKNSNFYLSINSETCPEIIDVWNEILGTEDLDKDQNLTNVINGYFSNNDYNSFNNFGFGGIEVGGEAFNELKKVSDFDASGGIEVGGEAVESYIPTMNIISIARVNVSGNADYNLISDKTTSGGILLSGSATVEVGRSFIVTANYFTTNFELNNDTNNTQPWYGTVAFSPPSLTYIDDWPDDGDSSYNYLIPIPRSEGIPGDGNTNVNYMVIGFDVSEMEFPCKVKVRMTYKIDSPYDSNVNLEMYLIYNCFNIAIVDPYLNQSNPDYNIVLMFVEEILADDSGDYATYTSDWFTINDPIDNLQLSISFYTYENLLGQTAYVTAANVLVGSL